MTKRMAGDWDDVERWIVSVNDYVLVEELPRDVFGEVLKERPRNPGGPAIVQMRIMSAGKSEQRAALREMEVLTKMNGHPAICEFYGWFCMPEVGVVTEWLPNGTLTAILDRVRSGNAPEWTPLFRSKLVVGIASAMAHLHARSAIHRHLSPDHIKFDAHWNPKLVNFAFSRLYSDDSGMSTITVDANSYEYTAPELLDDDHREPYTGAVDVFAFGMILYRIATGEAIWPEMRDSHTRAVALVRKERPRIPGSVSPVLKSVIENCWSHYPNERRCFGDIAQRLFNTDEPLFEGCDMAEFNAYRDLLKGATDLWISDEERAAS